MKDQLTIINAGVNGNNTADLLFRIDECVLSKKPELVILLIGTNDMLNMPNMLPIEKYVENYQKLISLITKQAKLIMMTIPPVDSAAILQRVDPELYSYVSPDVKIEQANIAVRKLAEKNNCHLIDLYKILQACGGATENRSSLFMNDANFQINDGVHPTIDGYRVIGTAVYQAVNILEPGVTNIVCYGDSITYGYKIKGEGTTEGDSYPAVLYRILTDK